MQWVNKIEMKTLVKLLLLLLLVLFIPYIILCFYAQPIGDDYTYLPTSPFWATQIEAYLHWNGRYSANFMVISNPIVYGSLTLYRFSAFVLLLLMPMSVFFAISSTVEKMLTPLQRVVISTITSLLVLSLLPSLPEGIYWYPGSVTYLLACIFAMFYIGLVARYFNAKYFIHPTLHLLLCMILLGLSIGFNEVQMFILLFGHFVVWLSINGKEKFKPAWMVLLFFTLLFSSFVFFAPGNYYRSINFPTNHSLFHSLYMSLLQMPRFFFSWVSYAPLLIASILFAPISAKLNKESVLFQKMGSYNPFVLFLLLWVILFFCIFPPYWSTAILGQHRTLNTACFFFILGWFVFIHSIYSRNGLGEKLTQILNRPVQIGLTLLLVFSLLFSGNSGTALMELSTGKIAAFNKEMNRRHDMLIAAKANGVKQIAVPLLENKPNSLFVLDIQPGCYYWVNFQYAKFFGLEKVYADSTKHIIYE